MCMADYALARDIISQSTTATADASGGVYIPANSSRVGLSILVLTPITWALARKQALDGPFIVGRFVTDVGGAGPLTFREDIYLSRDKYGDVIANDCCVATTAGTVVYWTEYYLKPKADQLVQGVLQYGS